jgi:hypothetical protein
LAKLQKTTAVFGPLVLNAAMAALLGWLGLATAFRGILTLHCSVSGEKQFRDARLIPAGAN